MDGIVQLVVVLEVEVVVVEVVAVVVMGGYYGGWIELCILTIDVVQQLNGGQQLGTVVDVDDAQIVEVSRFQFAEQLEVFVAAKMKVGYGEGIYNQWGAFLN